MHICICTRTGMTTTLHLLSLCMHTVNTVIHKASAVDLRQDVDSGPWNREEDGEEADADVDVDVDVVVGPLGSAHLS